MSSIQYNKVLIDTDRDNLAYIVDIFREVCPEVLAGKFPRANVQQAFGYFSFQQFYRQGDKVLFVGCYADTAFEALRSQGYPVEGIDPLLNYSLADFKKIATAKYNLIFSISVIEHVEDDEQFLKDICFLLAPEGKAVLTMDYRDSPGNKPVEDYRLYSKRDYVRFQNILEKEGCVMLDTFDPTGQPDFQYGNSVYSFSTLVFRKEAK